MSYEREIAELKQQVQLGETLRRLESNPDYQTIIKDGYLRDNVKGLISALSYASNADIRNRQYEKLLAVSTLQQFLTFISNTAERAEYNLKHPEEWQKTEEGDDE